MSAPTESGTVKKHVEVKLKTPCQDSAAKWPFVIVSALVLWATILLHLKLGKVYIGTKGVIPTPVLSEIAQNATLLFHHFQGGFARTFSGYVLFALMTLSFLSAGRWVQNKIFTGNNQKYTEEISFAEKIALHYLLGSLVYSLLWLALGLAGWLNVWSACFAAFIGCAGFVLQLFYQRKHHQTLAFNADTLFRWRLASIIYKVLMACGILWLILYSFTAVSFPQQADTLITHIALPNYYVNMGKIVFNPNHFHSYFPANTEMLVMWALLFKSEVAATLLMWGFYATFILLIWGFLRRYTDKMTAVFVALVALSIPTISNAAMTIKNDMPVSVFLLALFIALTECFRRPETSKRWALMAGILAGGAIAHKLTAFPVAGIIVVFLVFLVPFKSRESFSFRLPLIFSVGILIMAGPWFLRTFIETGNPVYPFLNFIFKGNAGEFFKQNVESKFYLTNEGSLSIKDYFVAALWGKTILNIPNWGPSIIFGILSIPIILMKFPGYFRISIGIALASFLALIWSLEIRFHIGLLSFIIFVPLALYLHIFIRNNKRVSFCFAVGVLLFCIYEPARNTFVVFKSSLNEMLSGNLPGNYRNISAGVTNMQWITHVINTRTKKDEKVLYAGIPLAYGLHRRYWYSSGFDKELIGQLAEASKSPEELRNRIQQMGINHILIKSTFFDDFLNNPIKEIRIDLHVLQKIKSLLDTYMVHYFASPDRTILWYVFKDVPEKPVVLNAKDAEQNPLMFIQEAQTQIEMKNPELATTMLQACLQVPMSFNNRLQAYKYLAAAYGGTGNTEKQRETLESAIKRFPDNPEFYYDLGVFQYMSGQYRESLDSFLDTIRLAPDYAEAYGNIGAVLMTQKKYPEALKYFETALILNPNDEIFQENIQLLKEEMRKS